MATLGDYPGLPGLMASDEEVLPDGFSVLEVNGLGEITADAFSIGNYSAGQDPFDFRPPSPEEYNDPQAKLHAGQDGGTLPNTDSSGSGSWAGSPDSGISSGSGYSGGSVDGFDSEQLANAAVIAEVGKGLGATDRDIQTAIMAAIVESGLRDLDYGDRDSIGMFQQRDAWGSREDRLDPAKSSRMFFLGGAAGQQGLLDIDAGERKRRSLGDLAQDVQVSAYPERYAQQENKAAAIMRALTQTPETGGKGRKFYGYVDGADAYDLTERDGKTVDLMTNAALEAATKEFGSGFRIMQGSHNHGGVAASGGTHDGGGVVDLDVPNGDWAGAVTALRKIGFAAWVRNVPGYGSAGSGAHIHAVLIGNERLSPQALTQVQSYLNNDDGLTGSRADDSTREFVGNRFVWGKPPESEKQGGEPWRRDVARMARSLIGTEFKWGGEDVDGVDQAGLIRSVYKQLGVRMPRTVFGQRYAADPIPLKDLKVGDLVAWDSHPEWGGEHVALYLGDGVVIEAGRPGSVVQLNELGDVTNAWGIPVSSMVQRRDPFDLRPMRPEPLPSPLSNGYRPPSQVQTTQIRPGTSVVEPHASMPSGPSSITEPGAHIPAKPPKSKPKPEGPHQNTTWGQKPHGAP